MVLAGDGSIVGCGGRTDAGVFASALGVAAQFLDDIFVGAEALGAALVGAVLELGGVDASEGGFLLVN